MDQVLKDLAEPRWCFSAFVVAILASLLAGFLKDALSRLLARSFAILALPSDFWYEKKELTLNSLRITRFPIPVNLGTSQIVGSRTLRISDLRGPEVGSQT
jgi:hypothetical protein